MLHWRVLGKRRNLLAGLLVMVSADRVYRQVVPSYEHDHKEKWKAMKKLLESGYRNEGNINELAKQLERFKFDEKEEF